METASDIIASAGGRAAVASLVSVKYDAVRFAEKQGALPAAWFDALEQALGKPLPRHLFTFKGAV